MKKILGAILLLLLAVVLYAGPDEIYGNPVLIHRFDDIDKNDMVWPIIINKDELRVLPFCDDSARWYIPTQNGRLRMYAPDFTFKGDVGISIEGFQSSEYCLICNDYITIEAFPHGFHLTSVQGKIVDKFIRLTNYPDEYYYLTTIENIVMYRKSYKRSDEYVSCVVDRNGGYKILDHSATLKYLEENIQGIHIDENIHYRDRILYFSRIDQIDDDGNNYGAVTLFVDQEPVNTIVGKQYNREDSLPGSIDSEGNLFQFDYTDEPEDGDKHVLVYYLGRTWGYKEPPKPATILDDGLRLRLRANTSAFVLGTLSKNQNITILKTGEKATIGGVTAPWYRVKTEDGLVGWAFGGFIKVTEN